MKQNITRKQWNGLNQEQKKILREKYSLSVYADFWDGLSIGQMIEFLGDRWITIISKNVLDNKIFRFPNNKNLCDCLWQAVKFKLLDK